VTDLWFVAKRRTYEQFLEIYDPAQANAVDRAGSTLLHAALANKPPERSRIAGRLLDDGADASAVTADGVTTAHVLLGRSRLDPTTDAPLLRRLFEGGSDPNRATEHFGTPLLTLARQLKFTDEALTPFYDVLLEAPGLDVLAPPPPARSTFEALVLLGDRRAALTDRVRALLRAQGQQVPPVPSAVARVDDAAAARRVALAVLDELEREYAVPLALWEGDPEVEVVSDHGDVWVVSWNSVEYLRTRDFSRQVLAGPIAVPKDGSRWLMLGTALPVDEELREWRAATGRGRASE